MTGVSSDMRMVHGSSIQKVIMDLGDIFLKTTTDADLGTRKRKDIIALQSWVKTAFSPLVLCFFLADRDDNLEGQQQGGAAAAAGIGGHGAAAGRNTTAALTEEEKAVQLRATLTKLLQKWVLPHVRSVIDSCDDPSVLSQTLVRALSTVRRDWHGYMMSTKYLLMSLETESGRSGAMQVEAVFKRTFQETVFQAFRTKLVESLHNVVTMVRADPDKIGQQDTINAQDLVRQFFDDVNTVAGDANGNGLVPGAPSASSAASTSGSEWAHSETKKLEDFHTAFVEPYKERMAQQFRDISSKFETNNDLASLLSWIPTARRHEMNLIRAIFYNVYPADFEALANNILYEFDFHVASHNASRLVEHQEFGIEFILKRLPLEEPNTKWDVSKADEETVPLLKRMKDLYSVSMTAQKAVAADPSARALPRTVTRNQRAVERRVQRENTATDGAAPSPAAGAAPAAAAAPVVADPATKVPTNAPAYLYFLKKINLHGSNAIKQVIDSKRNVVYKSPNDFATDIVDNIGLLFRNKDSIYKGLCENSADVARAYSDAFKAQLNDESEKPGYLWSASATSVSAGGGVAKTLNFPEVASHYVDAYIRSTETNVEDSSDIAAELISLLRDRDIFLDNHKHKTARRLLAKDFSEQVVDRENSILRRLSFMQANLLRKAGPGMIEDLQAFVAAQAAFEQHQAKSLVASDQVGKTAKINARIITGAFWPAYQLIKNEENLHLPASLVNCQRTFENFYRTRYATKALRWQHGRGSAMLEMAFPNGKKEVTVPIFQAICLLCVDAEGAAAAGKGITVAGVAKQTGMPRDEVEKNLAGAIFMRGVPQAVIRFADASVAKPQLLVDGVEINPDFQLKIKKFSLSAAQQATGATQDTTSEETMRNRHMFIDIAIVRIMKASKSMKYSQLALRVVESLERTFVPETKWIKDCVASLIEREFLERDQDDPEIFKYKA